MRTYKKRWNKEGYIKFTNEYSDHIDLDLGSWVDLKANELGLAFDIIHNLPLQSYNYEYKFHVDLSLLALLLKPQLINQAVDIVFNSIRIRNGYPNEIKNDDVIIHTKRDLVKAIMENKKTIYAVVPKKKATSTDHLKFCIEMQEYKDEVVKEIVYRKAMSKFHEILKVLA